MITVGALLLDSNGFAQRGVSAEFIKMTHNLQHGLFLNGQVLSLSRSSFRVKLLGSFAFPCVGLSEDGVWPAILVPAESEPKTLGDCHSRLHNAPEAVCCCITPHEKSVLLGFLTQTLCSKSLLFYKGLGFTSTNWSGISAGFRTALAFGQLKKLLSLGFT